MQPQWLRQWLCHLDRLARFLLGLSQQDTADAAEGGFRTINLGASQGDVALLMGGSRPKVNAALTFLEAQGAIVRDGSKIRCDCEELRVVAELE